MFLIVFLGTLLLLGALAIPFLKDKVIFGEKKADGTNVPPHKQSPPFLYKMTAWYRSKEWWAAIGVAIILMSVDGLFFFAKPGTAYALQYPWGGDKAITSQGIKAQWFGNPIPISFEIAIQDTIGEHEAQDEIYYRSALERELSGSVKARVAASIIVSINYHDEAQFLATADKNRSEGKLVHSRIISVYDQVLKNSCKLITAQEYIDGASSQLDFYLKDQLQHGMYLTEERWEEQTLTQIADTAAVRTVKASSASIQKQRKYIILRDKRTGEPLRDTTNSLGRYGLTVQQAAITFVDWERAFDDRLDQQKAKIAEIQLEKQSAEKEYYATQQKIQEGERLKATEQKRLETEQIKITMAAETQAKAAFYRNEEEQNLLNASKKSAERVRVEADANSYRNRQLVISGLTPQEKAYWSYRSDSVKWANVAKIQLPSTYFNGAGGQGKGSLIEDMIGAGLGLKMFGNGTIKPEGN